MPPRVKITKDDVINATLNIIKTEGITNISARRIAKGLKSSVQPIFTHFESMEELTNVATMKIYEQYKISMIEASKKEKLPYKAMGMAYIKFAKYYPEYFKVLFMQKSDKSAMDFMLSDNTGNNVVEVGTGMSGLSLEKQKEFHIKVWMFTHGIASLMATKTIEMSDSEIEDLLGNAVREMLIGFKKEEM